MHVPQPIPGVDQRLRKQPTLDQEMTDMIGKISAGLAVAATSWMLAGAAQAATYPTFVFDPAGSSVSTTETLDLCFGLPGDGCQIGYEFLPVADWTPTSPSDSNRVDDFLKFTVGNGLGGTLFNITATLAFSQPSSASGSQSGDGGVGTIFGILSGGFIDWADKGTINFADGSVLDFYLDDVAVGGFGNQTTIGVTFQGNTIAAVPLPAAGLLLLGALGGIGAISRRRRAA
jgi:hypothetical protein